MRGMSVCQLVFTARPILACCGTVSVCLSVTSWCFIETAERFRLIFQH